MALGKNLKKQKLITDKKSPKKPASKPKAKVQKKTLIKEEEVKPITFEKVIGQFITESQFEKKKQVRERQKAEVESLKDQRVQLIIFKVGSEEFAIEISKVKEVVLFQELSEAPNTPKHIAGLAAIRGTTHLVMDLSIKFNKEVKEKPEYLLSVQDSEKAIALMLGNLPVTIKCDGSQFSSDLSMLDETTKDVTYIKAIIQLDERLIFYLDVDELLRSDNAMVVPDELIAK